MDRYWMALRCEERQDMKPERKELGAQGFTAIEIMLAIAIAGIVMASFYSVYISQQSSYLQQEEVASDDVIE